jgi:hypothetical protein
MAAFLDTVMFTPTLGGTTDWVVSAAVQGYQTPALGNAVNGRVYKYRAESADLSQWEEGEGAYTVGTTTLARTTVLYNSAGTGTLQSGAGTKISFSTVPNVAVVQSKHDTISIEEPNSFSAAQALQACKNIGAVAVIKKQTFTASGTYTPSSNMLYCIIECVGGGGAGGGAAGSGTGAYGGGGGGSGGYSRTYASATAIGASQTVTVGGGGAGSANAAGGSGGQTSVGTLCIANGGTGGAASNSGQLGSGGPGASANTGDVSYAGNAGGPGFFNGNISADNVQTYSGFGGASVFGGSVIGVLTSGAALAGNAASSKGAGGSGAYAQAAGSAAGGAGAGGFVVITEFCSS